MGIVEIIAKHFNGSTAEACRALHVSRQAIHQWKKGGIPPLRQFHIDAVVKGIKPRRSKPQAVGVTPSPSDSSPS